ncbi:MAG TPA: IucA/IucC family protein, partial [Kribbella sp.]|nr:IucA/IucC family protein [Kribbella sp.]
HHYGITVNPHGENLAVICTPEGLPTRLVIKDLVDDINLSTTPIVARGPEPDTHTQLPTQTFWGLIRAELHRYTEEHPEYTDRLAATGLTGATFLRYPLNGYRLKLGYTDLDTRPPIPVTGSIPNPLHTVEPVYSETILPS